MSELENVGEQPKSVDVEQTVGDEILTDENGSPEQTLVEDDKMPMLSEAERGVPVGKFKSVDDLYTAYNNLQAEFTRKSQKLSALEKEKMTANPSVSNENLEDKFASFLSKNQEAVLYADELKSRVVQNESLKNEKDCFDRAWAQMLYEKLSSPGKAKEPIVQNFILKDNDLKNLIITDYMKQLQEHNTPFVMSSESGERVTKTVTPKPDTFEQAKKIVLDLLS